MKISGKYIICASPKIIWEHLLNPRVLEQITPGVKKLEKTGKDAYTAVSEVKVGPVRGKFEGDLEIKDKIEGKEMVVALDQKSLMGNALAEIKMEMVELEDGKTEIKYAGDVKMSGMLGRMGQRIIGGVASTLSKQFFSELEKYLAKNHCCEEE